jgi:hypothetical protein
VSQNQVLPAAKHVLRTAGLFLLCTARNLLRPAQQLLRSAGILLCSDCVLWRTGPGHGICPGSTRRCSGTGSQRLTQAFRQKTGLLGQLLPMRVRFLFSLAPRHRR